MTGFVYIWRDNLRNMYYIGSHIGSTDDGYISSSRWLNGEVKYRPNDFRRKIIKHVSIDTLKIEEYKLLTKIKDHEFGKRYYNLKHGKPQGIAPWNKGLIGIYTEEHRARISKSRKGRPTTKGRPNPISADNARKGAAKLSSKTKGRKRLYRDDGSWTWQYPK